MLRHVGENAVIAVDGLVYTYPGADTPAVKNVSFDVRKGEVFGLLGPSGAGKSTIQKVLTRQHRKIDDGKVSVLGRDIGQWKQDFYENIGVGFELPNHYQRMSARENLDFFASLYQRDTRRPEELLEMVGLLKAIDVRVSDFSKGMMMRLNFVRALLHDPEIFFFDEPTSGLDPVNGQRVKDIIRDLQTAGKTIVLTTHNMTDVDELCERVGFMVRGNMKTLDHVHVLKAQFGSREVEVEFEAPSGPGSERYALDGLGDNDAFLKRLREGGVKTLHSQEATLDKVFAAVTGTDLHADNDTVEAG
ncbi:MAG: ABC transporter ATP-binding protein [Pseudomonadota bacterium]